MDCDSDRMILRSVVLPLFLCFLTIQALLLLHAGATSHTTFRDNHTQAYVRSSRRALWLTSTFIACLYGKSTSVVVERNRAANARLQSVFELRAAWTRRKDMPNCRVWTILHSF